VIQLTKRDDSVYLGTDHPFRKRITSFLTQGLEKETVNHLCCYNETNDNKFSVISTKIKKSLLKAEIITWDSLEHGKQPTRFQPAYRSSKKVNDYDKLEAEVKKNRRMISLKETLL
ncbi:hypothetical protein IGI04_019602, partial [Brassica rapa subsp. trilocularis]